MKQKKQSGATIKKYMVSFYTWDVVETVEIEARSKGQAKYYTWDVVETVEIEARSKGQAKYFCYKKHFDAGISGKGLSFGMYLELFRPEAKEIKT